MFGEKINIRKVHEFDEKLDNAVSEAYKAIIYSAPSDEVIITDSDAGNILFEFRHGNVVFADGEFIKEMLGSINLYKEY